MAKERAFEGRAEAAIEDIRKAMLEQRERDRRAKYDAVIAKAKESGISEEGLTERIHSAYREYLGNLDFHSIMGLWDATEVSPLPVYREMLEGCETRGEFLRYCGLFRAYSRCKFSYPADLIQKHAQRLLDGNDTDAFIGFLYETTTKPGEVEIAGMIQDAYARLAADTENRYRMRNLIRVTRIAPDMDAMKQAAITMQKAGRYDEVRNLKVLLEKEVPKQKYSLHDEETALDAILNQ